MGYREMGYREMGYRKTDFPTLTAGLGLLLLATAPARSAQLLPAERLPACPPANQSACACNQNTVICQDRQLVRVPSLLPEDTRVLNLANNQMTHIIKGDLDKLERARTIYLQHNQIAYIQDGALANLYSLELLVLTDNNLSSIGEKVFQHLPSIAIIDLANNQLNHIHKRAFITLPAPRSSSSTSSITINLNGNSINCDCDARALRDWKRSLFRRDSTLTGVQFDSFQCRNAQGKELDNMDDNAFPSCSDAQLSMFNTGQSCVKCSDQGTQFACDAVKTLPCSSSQATCETTIHLVGGRISVDKTCSVYRECLLRAHSNRQNCTKAPTQAGQSPSMHCTFCCIGDRCNEGDFGGRTSSFQMYVGLRADRAFQDYMQDPQNTSYVQDANLYVQAVTSVLQHGEGGYTIRFLSFRNEAAHTFVSLLVHTTHLSTSVVEVGKLMTQALNASAYYGKMNELQVTYIYVGTEMANAKICTAQITNTPFGRIFWPETSVDSTARVACRPSPSSSSPTIPWAYRKCSYGAIGVVEWGLPDLDECGSVVNNTGQSLIELSQMDITASNVNDVMKQLKQLTSLGGKLTPYDVSLTMLTVNRALEPALTSSLALGWTVTVLSNLLDADLQVLVEADRINSSSSRLLDAIDMIAENGELTNQQMVLSSSNLVVAAQAIGTDTFQGLELTAILSSSDGTFQDGDVQIGRPNGNLSSVRGLSRLVLPASVLTSAPGSRVAMAVHLTDKAFEAKKQAGGTASRDDVSIEPPFVTRINSHIMAASIGHLNVQNLREPVTFTLMHDNENSTNARCVFWEDKENEWSSKGCRKVEALSNQNVTTCQCDHLTNFALLMDVYGRGLELSESDEKILSVISYIGCGISLLALLLTLLTYGLFNKLRRDNPSKILVNLCVALTLSNLIFVAGMHPYALDSPVGCKVVAVLLHFSLLSSMCWMMVEAFYMYLALVLVFKTYFTNFILKCSLVGWGIPIVIVAITLAVNGTDNYGPLTTGVCWLKDLSFYLAFVAPVCLILLVNFLAFALVLRQILGLSSRKLNKSDSFTTSQQLRGIVGVAILLGLTWIFAVLAVDRASVAFYYLFAIFNSLQGLWIFLFYCVLKKEARHAWVRMLRCQGREDRFSGIVTSSKGAYSGGGGRHEGRKSNNSTGTTSNAHSSAAVESKSFNSESDGSGVKGHTSSNAEHHPYRNVPSPPVRSAAVVTPNQICIDFTRSKTSTASSAPGDQDLNSAQASVPTWTSGSEKGTFEIQTFNRKEVEATVLTSLTHPEEQSLSSASSTTSSSSSTSSEVKLLQFRAGTALSKEQEPDIMTTTATTTATTMTTTPSMPGIIDHQQQPQQAHIAGRAVALVSPLRITRVASISPRPLHIKLGHAYSTEGDSGKTRLSESSADSETPTEGGDVRMSVAGMVKKFNTKL